MLHDCVERVHTTPLRMPRRLYSLVLLPCLSPTLRAQDVGFFGGYSYVRTTGVSSQEIGLHGWGAAASANLGPWGVVADFSNHYGANASDFAPIGSSGHGFTYLFGPRYSFRTIPRVTPFVHALFGGVRGVKVLPGPLATLCPVFPNCQGFLTQPETAFATALGGGIDVKATDHVWIRLAQVDYLRENFSNGALNSPRFSTGIVLRFGRR